MYLSNNIKLTFNSFIYFIISVYIASLAVSFADRHNINSSLPEGEKKTLYDPLLDYFTLIRKKFSIEQNSIKNLPDTIILYSLILILIKVFTLGSKGWILTRRILLITGLLYLIRAPFLILTILPTPLQSCVSNPDSLSPIWIDAFYILIQKRAACGDVFWSGHTIIYTTTFIVWNMEHFTKPIILYSLNKNNNTFKELLLKICSRISVIIWLAGCLSLVFSTYHYTNDIIFAIIFTYSIWTLYNLILQIPEVRHHFVFLGKLIIEYENNRI